MNETVTVFLAIFLPIIVLSHLKTLLKLRKIRRNGNRIPDDFFLSELLTCCGDFVQCAAALDDASGDSDQTKTRREIAYEEIEKRKSSMSEKEKEKIELKKIKSVISEKQKTSLWWISTKTTIPKERIIELITKDPNYTIENEYIINIGLLGFEEASTYTERKLLAKKAKEREEKIAMGICPECNNSIKIGAEYCLSCGIFLD
ncbi:MAG TPA: hypothetical protein VMX55_13150 [candidate division Zixibacteria bacterium]|nr:hypothetical protein [candidate division Zixibacteria bacterium]